MKKTTKFCPYETITNKIIEALEQGVVPWRCGWDKLNPNSPVSLSSGSQPRPYSGINNIILGMAGFNSHYWVTYKQAKAMGGNIKKGSKAMPASFFKWSKFEVKNADGETEEKKVPLFRVYSVFNLEQTEGIPAEKLPADAFGAGDSLPVNEWNPNDIADDLITESTTGKLIPEINHDGGSSAFYRPRTDSIHLPKRERFHTASEYYHTLFHEAVHATGHSTRLNRALDTDPKPFGSADYSREELVAELGACFLMQECKMEPTIDNSASYIESWLKVLKGNKKLIPTAGAQASKAHRWIIGEYQKV